MDFRRVLEALPPEALVPVGWVLENIGGNPNPVMDYRLEDLAELTGSSVSTIRTWCDSGRLRAYRLMNREWRIPVEAWREFQAEQAKPERRIRGRRSEWTSERGGRSGRGGSEPRGQILEGGLVP